MKNRTKSTALILSGVIIGTSLSGPVVNAAAEFFQAQRTPHPIYVDGQRVQMETYAINGSNYVKLRDIGQLRSTGTARQLRSSATSYHGSATYSRCCPYSQ